MTTHVFLIINHTIGKEPVFPEGLLRRQRPGCCQCISLFSSHLGPGRVTVILFPGGWGLEWSRLPPVKPFARSHIASWWQKLDQIQGPPGNGLSARGADWPYSHSLASNWSLANRHLRVGGWGGAGAVPSRPRASGVRKTTSGRVPGTQSGEAWVPKSSSGHSPKRHRIPPTEAGARSPGARLRMRQDVGVGVGGAQTQTAPTALS